MLERDGGRYAWPRLRPDSTPTTLESEIRDEHLSMPLFGYREVMEWGPGSALA